MSNFILGPAVENASLYADAQIAFHAAFMNYLEIEKPDPLEPLFMELPSSTAQESHLFIGDVPAFQEWTSAREMGSLAMHRINVLNKNWASGIGIHRNQIEDDRLGLVMPSIARLAGKAKRHRGKLIAELLINGFAGNLFSGEAGDGTTYDSALMFSATHTLEGGPNQSNTLGATALSYTGLESAITKMRQFTTYDGLDPLEVDPTHLFVGPALEFTGRRLLEQELTVLIPNAPSAGTWETGGQTNIHKGRLKLVVSPRIRNYPGIVDASKYWFVAALGEPIKPFLFQNREPITTAMQVGWDSPEMFQKGVMNFGAQARYNASNFDWRLLVGSTGGVIVTASLRITAMPGLAASAFRHGPIAVVDGQWSTVDPNDPATRAILLGYVGTHVRLFPSQDLELAAAGLELRKGRLADVLAEKRAAATVETEKKTATTKKS